MTELLDADLALRRMRRLQNRQQKLFSEYARVLALMNTDLDRNDMNALAAHAEAEALLSGTLRAVCAERELYAPLLGAETELERPRSLRSAIGMLLPRLRERLEACSRELAGIRKLRRNAGDSSLGPGLLDTTA